MENVNSVKKLMEEISTAAKEEAEGVSNITIAMNEIDATTHANSDMAHQTMGYADTLSKQSNQLRAIIRDLDLLVTGTKGLKKVQEKKAQTKLESPVAAPVEEAAPDETEAPSNVVQLSASKKKPASATPEDFDNMPMAAGGEGESQAPAQVDPNDPGFGKE